MNTVSANVRLIKSAPFYIYVDCSHYDDYHLRKTYWIINRRMIIVEKEQSTISNANNWHLKHISCLNGPKFETILFCFDGSDLYQCSYENKIYFKWLKFYSFLWVLNNEAARKTFEKLLMPRNKNRNTYSFRPSDFC